MAMPSFGSSIASVPRKVSFSVVAGALRICCSLGKFVFDCAVRLNWPPDEVLNLSIAQCHELYRAKEREQARAMQLLLAVVRAAAANAFLGKDGAEMFTDVSEQLTK